jgi:hypothetical protein
MPPELFEPVEIALLGGKEVDNDWTEIQDHPAGQLARPGSF